MAGDGMIRTVDVSPEQLADKAEELISQGNIGVAYTYNEPLVGYEYVRDCAALVHDRGMDNVLVTNGTIAEQPWRELLSSWMPPTSTSRASPWRGTAAWAAIWTP